MHSPTALPPCLFRRQLIGPERFSLSYRPDHEPPHAVAFKTGMPLVASCQNRTVLSYERKIGS